MSFPDAAHMRAALGLAAKGLGRTSPNPAVGAVLVRGKRVVGAGFHRKAGLPHAEVEAIRAAGAAARGADLYVTLEPCAHTGRTGPCTEAILSAGIRRVAAAMEDPNPLVAGKGFAALRAAGVAVAAGLMEREARELNAGYCRWIATGRPYVTLKLAMSMDGQIAAASGSSRWISGARARAMVHRMRSRSDAVLVGGETLRKDDPLLTARVRGANDPKRIVLTSRLDRLSGRRIVREGASEVIVVAPRGVPARDVERARALGARVMLLPARRGRIGAGALMRALGREGIASLLVEGGGRTAGWLLTDDAVDRFVFFIAPLLLGDGIRAFSGFSGRRVAEGRGLAVRSVRRVGDDLMVTAERRE